MAPRTTYSWPNSPLLHTPCTPWAAADLVQENLPVPSKQRGFRSNTFNPNSGRNRLCPRHVIPSAGPFINLLRRNLAIAARIRHPGVGLRVMPCRRKWRLLCIECFSQTLNEREGSRGTKPKGSHQKWGRSDPKKKKVLS